MFTGIVEELGMVKAINQTEIGILLKVNSQKIYSDVKLGDSIAIDGVCLTVVGIKDNILSYDVMRETLDRTTLGGLKIGDIVNMEQSLRPDSRIGGHFVSGHIDYKARINDIINYEGKYGFRIALPAEFSKFVVEKGSIALDGVSLTVADVSKDSFLVYLIPLTLKITTLGKKKKGDLVNVETDIIGKYIAKKSSAIDLKNLLEKYEYL